MNKIRHSLAILALGFLTSCGGKTEAVSADAQTFCDCLKNMTAECAPKLREMTDRLKDPKTAQAFLADVQKTCPEASKMLQNMMPK